VERCASLLREGGRLGLVIPSSMSEQAGYAPVRRAHDALCVCDPDLPDMGEDAFSGVFQPCMVLHSTRRATRQGGDEGGPWPVERKDLDREVRALLSKFGHASLPPSLFGERGLQSFGEDTSHFKGEPDALHDVPMRVGGDIEAGLRRAPSLYADAAWFGRRLREPAQWRAVKLYIRQTARVPMVAWSDGEAFRNSILAGFEDDAHPAAFLLAYLNSTPIRFVHFMRHRDARQGMPQMKIGHLRDTPAPSPRCIAPLARVGDRLVQSNRGVGQDDQREIDALVADAFGLVEEERARIATWAATLS
jgi:hypothetical protein